MLLPGLRQTFHRKQNISPQALNKKLKAKSAASVSFNFVTSSTWSYDSADVLFDFDKDVFSTLYHEMLALNAFIKTFSLNNDLWNFDIHPLH